ncbi:flagellar hook-length control protein FliK [Candidatus Liberibacter africanus]|uniref:Flagellar hook-length control protein-like C-terminal domain-containing protein n=1 Tax=Candidatus Liberibacter africanus PTSAPSY TaxID=1277257 RepID=A0A0G3I3A2_LIBAF|nr:flagellar hook-length control protein FliK [Candidatus Liberibacter africanus]AKK20374.1 hypothetical protein G293_03740 [Candidatus Liberibacter africanus PTSAPSY]QTP64111.1 flagellar hook-length control protein FliK [Candidatus Liberibacter africanus]
MKEINNIISKNSFDINQCSSDYTNNQLDSTQGKKKNSTIKIIGKNSNKQAFDIPQKYLFKNVLSTISNTSDSQLHGEEELLINSDLTHASCEKLLCPKVLQDFNKRYIIDDKKDIPSVESFSQRVKTIDHLDYIIPYDFAKENPLEDRSSNEEMRNLDFLFVPCMSYYKNNLASLESIENTRDQKYLMHFPMIPESCYYTDQGSIKTLKIQMKPNSPDNVIATLSLSGDKLSVKLQVKSDSLYKKIHTERQDILDALNFSGYTIDHFDVDFMQKDFGGIFHDSMNYFAQQHNPMQSNNFDRKKFYSLAKERVEKKVFGVEKRSGAIYSNDEIIGIYSNYFYV